MTTGIFSAAITCGGACWHAKEEKCVCSCAGANHGRLKGLDESAAAAQQPKRRRRIAQTEYRLIAVLNSRPEAMSYCKARGVRYVRSRNKKTLTPELLLISRVREPQFKNWPECKGFEPKKGYWPAPHIVWARADYDVQEPVQCEYCDEYDAPFNFQVAINHLPVFDNLHPAKQTVTHSKWYCDSYERIIWRERPVKIPLRE